MRPQLSNRSWGMPGGADLSFFQGLSQVFKEGRNLKRWLIVASLFGMPMGTVVPFVQPFAREFKGADQFVLGAMVTAFAVVPLLLGIPFGRISDRIGRKKIIYLTIPLVWVSYLMLIVALNRGFLIASGAFQGFLMMASITTEAMSRELVPPEQMGRWIGFVRLCQMSFGALTVYLFGRIWDGIGPQYVFVAIMALDLVRIPVLMGVPETLHLQVKTK